MRHLAATLSLLASGLVPSAALADAPTACIPLDGVEAAEPYRAHQLDDELDRIGSMGMSDEFDYQDTHGDLELSWSTCPDGDGFTVIAEDWEAYDTDGTVLLAIDGVLSWCDWSDDDREGIERSFTGSISSADLNFVGSVASSFEEEKDPPYHSWWSGSLQAELGECAWVASFEGSSEPSDADAGVEGGGSGHIETVALDTVIIRSEHRHACDHYWRGSTTLGGEWIDTARWSYARVLEGGVDEDRDGFDAEDDPDDEDPEVTPCAPGDPEVSGPDGDCDGCSSRPGDARLAMSLATLSLLGLAIRGRRCA
jgi:hypothetical protein